MNNTHYLSHHFHIESGLNKKITSLNLCIFSRTRGPLGKRKISYAKVVFYTTDVYSHIFVRHSAVASLLPCFGYHIPLEVFHRVASMASGGMDTLPHNGAVITLLAITGLSHRQAYGGIFAITVIKSLAVLFVIGVFYTTGIV